MAQSVVDMLSAHSDYNVATGSTKAALRDWVVRAATAIPSDVRVAMSVAPPPDEVNGAILATL